MKLFAELKRRNVIRMAGLYLVGAWLVVQVAETLLPVFGTPDWVLKTLILLLAIGFVPTLVFSWLYELTPDGLKRDGQVQPGESIAPQTARRLDLLTLAALLGVVALVAYDRLWPGAQPADASAIRALPSPATELNPGVAALASTTDTDADNRRSIAVLPFVNMSSDPENEHFADGMSEELLNILAGIEGLKVASRTSAFSFKGKDTPIPEIARQLDVHHVLEGSVRKQGNRVRITAQLIEAGSDAHLWTQTYQRDLDDIFLVQEEIATAITTALQDILGAQQVKVDAPTRDMEAYQRYLHGRSRFYQRVELDEAVVDLQFAVERDSAFAEAWAFLAASHWVLGSGGYPSRNDPAEMLRLAAIASDRANALKSDIPIGLAVQGQLVADSAKPGRIAERIRLFERAAAIPSPDTTPRLWLALAWLELGYAERALPLLKSAQRADPMMGINNGYLGLVHAIEGRPDEARALALRAVKLNGLTFWAYLLMIDQYYDQGPGAAVALLNEMQPLFSGERAETERSGAASLIAMLEDPTVARTFLAAPPTDLTTTSATPIFSILTERADLAFEQAEQGVSPSWFLVMSPWLPAMQWLREDPRYFRLMERRGNVEYWDSHSYPRGCTSVDGPDGRHLSCPRKQ